MAIARSGGATRRQSAPSLPGSGGSIQRPIHQVAPRKRPGLEKLQGLARQGNRRPAPDVEGEMAALQEQLAGAGSRRSAGGQDALAGLRDAFASSGAGAPAAGGGERRLGVGDGAAALHSILGRQPSGQTVSGPMEGLEELLALLGQGGL